MIFFGGKLTKFLILLFFELVFGESFDLRTLNLPESHLSQYFNKFPELRDACQKDKSCKFYDFLNSRKYDKDACWGYEKSCNQEKYRVNVCDGNHTGYVESKEAQHDVFFAQTDFGFVKEQIDEMQVMCEPLFLTDSSLVCSKDLRFCRGRNIMFNFTELKSEWMR
jgi:protein O-GlcNAc transferase